MQTMKFDRIKILGRLTKNRDAQRKIQTRAIDGWKREYAARLERAISDIKNDMYPKNPADIFDDLERPQDVLRHYDLAIEMLEMSTENLVDLSQAEFRNLVLDQWDWKESWTGSNLKYTSPR